MAQKSFIKKVSYFVMMSIALGYIATTLTSCSPEFQQGFRDGWNKTAPKEWRY